MPKKKRKLLTRSNPKTQKGEGHGYLTAILHLAPHKSCGKGNTCPWATPGCIKACLNTAGRGGICRKGEVTNAIQEARKERTRLYYKNRAQFIWQLSKEIKQHIRLAHKYGLKPAVRLNGTSDLQWQYTTIAQRFREVKFYDYTKNPNANFHDPDYHLTFSRTEKNWVDCLKVLQAGGTVAIVFRGELPNYYNCWPVFDGDQSDLRFLDPKGHIIGVKAKGKAKKDQSGFVVDQEGDNDVILVNEKGGFLRNNLI